MANCKTLASHGSVATGANMFHKVRQFHVDFSSLVLWENKPLGGDHDG